ncbi:MAG: 4-(cytidine 5'-diphospho)-2-C-methyl-D-erythritol kinase [Burkholderiales bacterium]|nr:4-(cytidine 5'-diphospho)-2-C-methyl-D-erythritol kinase [Burkholderiales bacterium]
MRALYDLAAPAKLNLFLHVIGRRADGYHLLQSIFVLIDWVDVLHFELRDDARLTRHDLAAALPDDDLCLRAAKAFQARTGVRHGVDISIDKQIPWGAGLGGGSSNAASVLLALNRLWGVGWPLSRLLDLGLELGADVPFFLAGTNAFVQGVGERLTPVTIPGHWLAVIKPSASLATRAVFASPLLVRDSGAVIVESFPGRASSGTQVPPGQGLGESGIAGLLGGFGRNDLQRAAQAQCVEVARAAELLQARFGNSRMTGSGSAVFARAGTDAQPVAALPAPLAPGWVGRMCRSLEHHPLLGWARD